MELGVNPPPVTTSVTAGPFIGDTFGVSKVSTGAGLLIVNVSAPLVPPDGSGLKIVTDADPGVVRSLAGIAALSVVPLTTVVVRFAPFHWRTVTPGIKPVPVAARVNPALPAGRCVGVIVASVGAGLGLPTLKLIVFDRPPPGPGLNTWTGLAPAVLISSARIVTTIWVGVVEVGMRSAPLNFTMAPGTKLLPEIVNAKLGPPTSAPLGVNALITGVGFGP
jgi:hypothetical protein